MMVFSGFGGGRLIITVSLTRAVKTPVSHGCCHPSLPVDLSGHRHPSFSSEEPHVHESKPQEETKTRGRALGQFAQGKWGKIKIRASTSGGLRCPIDTPICVRGHGPPSSSSTPLLPRFALESSLEDQLRQLSVCAHFSLKCQARGVRPFWGKLLQLVDAVITCLGPTDFFSIGSSVWKSPTFGPPYFTT